MKFRANIRDDIYIREFISILSMLAKMDKHVVFNLRENTMVLFICCEDFDTAPILWVGFGLLRLIFTPNIHSFCFRLTLGMISTSIRMYFDNIQPSTIKFTF